MFVALGEAAREHGSGVVFLIDEVQFLDAPEFEALIAAIHKTVQRQLPITLVGAGLPQLPRLAGEAKSVRRAAVQVPADRTALRRSGPGRAGGVGAVVGSRLRHRIALGADRRVPIEGYPYFLQEYGTRSWNQVDGPLRDRPGCLARPGHVGGEAGRRVLPGPDRAHPRARAALPARDGRARIGRGGPKTSPRSRPGVGAARPYPRAPDRKGLLYTPGRGLAGFTVPQFDRFMRRTYPLQ